MKRIIAYLVITVIGVLVLSVLIQWAREQSVSDSVRIATLIDQTRVAIERRDTASIMNNLHTDFVAFGNNREQTRMQLFGWFRQGYRLSLSVTVKDIRVQGETARVNVNAAGEIRSDNGRVPFRVPAVLTLQRTPSRYMLVLPIHSWKITGLETTLPDEFTP